MPRKPQARLAIEAHLQRLEATIAAPETPEYVRQRAISTVLRQHRLDERSALEKAKLATPRKAERDQTERASRYVSHLPDNGRLIRD
jgi:hypothetical protein